MKRFDCNCHVGTSEECMILTDDDHMCQGHGDQHSQSSGNSGSRSPSRVTESTEHSTSFNFDMSNRVCGKVVLYCNIFFKSFW